MAVSTEGLQVGWVIVKAVAVYVVYVQLADVYWLEVTVFAVIFFVYRIRVDRLIMVSYIDSPALIPTSDWLLFVPYLYLSGTAN